MENSNDGKTSKDTRGYEIVGPFTNIYECYKAKKEEVKV
jgi:hypothetical protein